MKKTYKVMLVAGVSVMTIGLAGSAFAFHDGGVAHCDGCHSMHNSADNQIGFDRNGNPTGAVANSRLMKGSDPSSTCLNCHARDGGYGVLSTAGTNKSQGGDFYWAKVDYTFNSHGTKTSSKDNHGHNIVAADYGLAADTNTNNTNSPGGTYPAANLGCTSCHDPHGKVDGGTSNGTAAISVSGSYGAADPTDGSITGNYRLLGDVSYVTSGHAGFTNEPPVARANGSSGAWVDYGSGMSEWCANCHSGLLFTDSSAGKHPAGNTVKLGGYVNNYNSYVATGDFTGDAEFAYDLLVPIEKGTTDRTALGPVDTSVQETDPVTGALVVDPVTGDPVFVTNIAGADANSNVMCLTCHRAHASAFDNALRWDYKNTEMIAHSPVEDAATIFSDGSTAGSHSAYYAYGADVDVETEYGPYQRSLCNKCHARD